MDENILYNAAAQMLENYRKYIVLSDWQHICTQFDTIVFENAQGLMLDWDNEEYSPHLTASHTGLKNITGLLTGYGCPKWSEYSKELKLQPEIIYVSRTYVTRHGAGRLDHECSKEEINPEMTDQTNLPNPWQGTLRYARHPAGDDFFRYIRRDLAYLSSEISLKVTLLMTHPEETNGQVLFADKARTLEELQAYCHTQAPGLFHNIMYLPWSRFTN